MSSDVARDWLKALGALTAGTMSAAEARAKIGAYQVFMDQWPAWALTPKSLEYVARQCKFFPAYAELCEHLGAWCKDNRPAQLAIGEDKPPGWEKTDEFWLRYYRDGLKHVRPSFVPGGLSYADHMASLVRRQSPRAAAVLGLWDGD